MGFIDYEVDGQVGIITINRPKALNALNSTVLDELNETLDAVDQNEIRCLILTGAGEKSFVAGADIGEMFGPGGEGFMRLNVAELRSVLEQALLQLEEAVRGLG